MTFGASEADIANPKVQSMLEAKTSRDILTITGFVKVRRYDSNSITLIFNV